jgi:hypothetical protein
MPGRNLLALRVFEGLCVVLIAALVWFCVIRPWRRTGSLSLDGKFVIAGFFALVACCTSGSFGARGHRQYTLVQSNPVVHQHN